MERGSFSSPKITMTTTIVAAAEKVASSIDFDMVCSSTNSISGSTASSEDEEKTNMHDSDSSQQGERQSLLQQNQDQRETQHQSHFNLQNLHLNSLNLPHIDMNSLNLPHIDMNNLNLPHIDMENFEFHNLPVEIQMALEDTLLGWTHLTSITIGHVLLPWVVFHTVQQASKYVLERTVYILNTQFQAPDDGMELGNSVEAVLVSAKTHFILGLVAGIAAFRVIRHRRRVWFRHAYGSKAYKQCEEGRRRREAVLRADRDPNSLLSLSTNNDAPSRRSPRNWLSNYKKKRHKKKLRQASVRFERHHTGLSPRNSVASSCSVSTTKTRLDSRRQKPWQDDYDSTSVAPTEEDYDSSSSEENVQNDISKKPTTANTNNQSDNTICPNKSSIAHDAVSIPRINNVPYAHGGFFGAAPFFLADRRWVTILRELLPDVYVEISRRVGTSHYYSKLMGLGRFGASTAHLDYTQDASKLIHWAENNPVVAAYGVAVDLQIKQELRINKMNSNATKINPSESTIRLEPTAATKPILESAGTKRGSIIDQFYNQSNGVVVTQVQTKGEKIENKRYSESKEQEKDEPIVIPNLEWDIFVDPHLVRRVEAVLDAMNGYVASKIAKKRTNSSVDKEFGHTNSTKTESTRALDGNENSKSKCESCAFCTNNIDNSNKKETNFEDEDSGESEAAALLANHDHNSCNNLIGINNLCGTSTVDVCNNCVPTANGTNLGQTTNNSDFFVHDDTSSTKHDGEIHGEDICLEHLSRDPVLRYLERELERRTQELTDRLLIAHGNVLQLIMEQSGVLKDWNYSRVQRTRRTLGGGMYARQWMAVFAEALRLGMKQPQKGGKRCSRKNPNRESNTTKTFFDDEKDYRYSGSSETDALLSPGRAMQYVFEGEEKFDEEDSDGEEYDDLFESDRYDPLEDDNNHCTCSPRCCLDTTMAESLQIIERITQTKEPIGILLDLKSRHVPKRVLSLMVRSLQTAGIRVVGIASFDMSDIRGVCSHPQTIFQQSGANGHVVSKIPMGVKPPLATTKEILMVHSAGDLQAACDEGLVRPGDHVFFNGGSLILDSARSSTVKSFLGFFVDMCACGFYSTFDPCVIEDGYKIQSYGYACSSMDAMETAECFANETRNLMERSCNGNNSSNLHHQHYQNAVDMDVVRAEEDTLLLSPSSSCDDETEMGAVMKTLADYKKHYGFSMGLYLQEFSIDEAAARLLIDLVNNNPEIYDLGLAWGGINGMTVHGIQPGRFTSTDGYWNQRRLGKTWKSPF